MPRRNATKSGGRVAKKVPKVTAGRKRYNRAPSSRRFDKARDEAERKKIAATFDVAAFEATTKQTGAQTTKEWSKPF